MRVVQDRVSGKFAVTECGEKADDILITLNASGRIGRALYLMWFCAVVGAARLTHNIKQKTLGF